MDSVQTNRMGKHVIGITGGIGAGKSVVSRILRTKGFPVYDCDTEAKRLMDTDGNVIQQLKSLLGDRIYREDGSLDRPRMASAIFSDKEIRKRVNHIVHRAVRDDFVRWMEKAGENVFIESAILDTGNLDSLCSEIWYVDSPVGTRIQRVRERNGLAEEEIRRRIDSQSREFDRLTTSKIITIDNGGSVPLLEQVEKLLKDNN